MPRKTGKNLVSVNLEPTPEALKDMSFWRAFAKALVPKEDDEWHIGEIATLLQENSELVAGHWKEISRVCNKTDGKEVNISMAYKINRTNTPSTVNGSISYSEKYGERVEKKTPDPNQKELPLTTEQAEALNETSAANE